jgi:uncharacterized protein (TIGR01244 family)
MNPLMTTLAALLLAADAQVPASMPEAEIAAYHLVRPGLAIAGRPSSGAVARLKDLGFRTIIDLRQESEGTADEKAAVEAQGLRYVWVPFTAASFTLADAKAVARALGDPEAGPVLLHCASANRAGGVWTVLQAIAGKPIDQAEQEGRKFGLRSDEMLGAARRVAKQAVSGSSKAP